MQVQSVTKLTFICTVDKRNCIIDELNKVLTSDAGVDQQITTPGLETLTPLIFLDQSIRESNENLTEFDEHLPVLGDHYFLPKENIEDQIFLPIISNLGK